MGTQGWNKKPNETGTRISDSLHSEAWRYGRRLKLEFSGEDVPVLHRIEFRPRKDADPDFREQDSKKDFSWADVPKAVSLVVLKYLLWDKRGREDSAYLTGRYRDSLAATLGDAITNEVGFVEVFSEVLPAGKIVPRVKLVFGGENLHGKAKDHRDRRIRIQESYLPTDCIQIFWDARGKQPLSNATDFDHLMERLGKASGISIEPRPVARGTTPESSTPNPHPSAPTRDELGSKKQKVPSLATDLLGDIEAPPPPQRESFNVLGWMARELSQTLDVLRGGAKSKIQSEGVAQKPAGEGAEKEPLAKPSSDDSSAKLSKTPASEPSTVPLIPPELFKVPPTNGNWPDETPLLNFPEGQIDHFWTLKNAFEGVLIFGRTGSGKTSGSGAAFAEQFLRTGFGGLVLTVKKDEAEYWRRLCRHCGRENDLIVVTRGGRWKFNVLAYEAQCPGRGSGLSENLTTFCRNLLRISVRSKPGGANEQIWETAGDQLLNATFDLFLLAEGSLTFDRLAAFVAAAPTDRLPTTEADWLKLPVFGSVFLKAKSSIRSEEDQRIFQRATGYWFSVYPTLSSRTRTSVTLGIYAMFDAFRGRDIPALISSETNVTPESIMAGKIVVLDLPLKELRHTGLMVQSAWKYSFQIALERHARKNKSDCRPVFLWEDEGQYLVSNHDHHFQDTARSARVCRVLLSQNLQSFYKEFGESGRAAADAVLSNLNTKVFHNNSDPLTNTWAADHLGTELRTRVSINHNPPKPGPASDLINGLANLWNPPETAGVSTSQNWEYAVQPGDFNKLRSGGVEDNFQVDAYLTWMGLKALENRHFIHMTFFQNQNV